ncbi:MAG TPA: hypothetical protein EYP85_00585 [Armatimonadetes bacterium]|nr:hypothetical protein [Armatimonadota bacterium]
MRRKLTKPSTITAHRTHFPLRPAEIAGGMGALVSTSGREVSIAFYAPRYWMHDTRCYEQLPRFPSEA